MSKIEKPEELKVVFAPGCFDTFEGTQEELDELMAEIGRLITTGEFFDKSEAIDIDELSDEELREFAEDFGQADKRNLQ
jgi:hypothetical protein